MLSRIAGVSLTLEDDGADPFADGRDPDATRVRERLCRYGGVEEAFVLRTCQRFECYAYGESAPDGVRTVVAEAFDLEAPPESVQVAAEAVEHLFRVACGLESGVLGEDEVLGQIRDAYRAASTAGTLEGPLDTVVLKAIRVGERARTETTINEGTVSLGSVTLEAVADRLGEVTGSSVLVIGAGEVAELVVKALAHRDAERVTVANRTLETARTLAAAVDGEAVTLAQVPHRLSSADVVITATGAPEPVISSETVADERALLVDLANPPDVAAAVETIEGVDLLTLEEVLSVRTDGLERRREAIPAVEELIDEERERLVEQLRAERVDDALSEIYSHAHGVRESELEQALDRLDAIDGGMTDEQETVIRDFSEALVNTLLHPKTSALKQAAAADDRETVAAWLELFDAGFESARIVDDENAASGDADRTTRSCYGRGER